MKKLFIIHGWTYSLDKWTDFCKLLRAQGIEPVQLRVPGLTQPSDEVWDIDGYIDWLDTQLADEKEPIVMGHSNGGRIALAYVKKHPGKIAKLILLDSAGIPHEQAKSKVKLQTLKVLSKAGKPLAHIPPLKKAFYRAIGAQDYLQAPPNMKQTMRHMLDADKRIKLGEITVPVTIIWGSNDAITPLTDGQKMHTGLTNSTLHVVSGARHAPQFTHASQVAEIVGKVLAQ